MEIQVIKKSERNRRGLVALTSVKATRIKVRISKTFTGHNGTNFRFLNIKCNENEKSPCSSR